jgi:membrane associated rhomboid family serine protease
MFPIRDHNPAAGTPVVTLALIVANILVFLLMLPATGNDRAIYAILNTYALIPAEFTAGQDRWTLVTSMFLHAGFWHIAGNMLFLWIFGDNLEDQMGHLGFLLFYLAAGCAGGLMQIAADPVSRLPTVGASGAIAGVMGGYLLLFPRARVDLLIVIVVFVRIIALPAWAMLGYWFVLQLVSGLAADLSQGGVAYWAHAGGFGAGLALTLPVWLRRGATAFWQRTDGHPPHPVARSRIAKVPRR